jgi:hypothetical protein
MWEIVATQLHLVLYLDASGDAYITEEIYYWGA